jgi:methionyl-tRNA formyltransferase
MTISREIERTSRGSGLVLLANNRVGLAITEYLRSRRERIVAVVVHPAGESRFRDEIVEAAGVSPDCVLDARELGQPSTLAKLTELAPSVGVSAFFGYILHSQVIELFPAGVLNVHPAFLPYNRGVNTNVWSIVEHTPAGATIHYIDEGIDTGDIVAQREVAVRPADTGLSLYRRLEDACVSLFTETWPHIIAGTAPRVRQIAGAGTFHHSADVSRIDEIDLDARCTAREVIDRIRARSFPPYTGTYFIEDGRKIFLRLELYEPESSERDR